MSESLEGMYNSMLDNKVPLLWSKVAYPSEKCLSSWIKDVHKRIQFISQWVANGQPSAFWFSGFFFPQGFMTGMLQNFARKSNLPINTLEIATRVVGTPLEQIKESPEDGVYIYGLFMEGGKWDYTKESMTENEKGEMASVCFLFFCFFVFLFFILIVLIAFPCHSLAASCERAH